MRKFLITVIADGMPLTHRIPNPTVDATNHGKALDKAYKLAKTLMRRGTKKVTVSADWLK